MRFYAWTCTACGCAPLDMWQCPCGATRHVFADVNRGDAKRLADATPGSVMADVRDMLATIRRQSLRVVK